MTTAQPSMFIRKIVSGGQTGADRAGLDWAIANGVPHGGYCPKGRLAEDGAIPSAYMLVELKSKDYPARTKKNAQESDGTVIFTMGGKLKGGSKLTAEAATQFAKPWLHICGSSPIDIAAAALRSFVEENGIQTLNVAGSRGSKEPEVGAFTEAVLSAAFSSR